MLDKLANQDNLLDFTIPNWAAYALVNSDNSALNDEDEDKLKAFEAQCIEDYGNSFFMLAEDSESDLGFHSYNDIDNLGSDCTKLYLKITKK